MNENSVPQGNHGTRHTKIPKKIGKGSKYKILIYLLDNVGKPVSTEDLKKASGFRSEYARRVRELRDEFGYDIRSHKDDLSIPVNHYMLTDSIPTTISHKRNISNKTRALVLQRDGYTCQSCGASSDIPHHVTGKQTMLHVSHIHDKSMGGTDALINLRTLCSVCNQGAKNITPNPTPTVKLMAQVRQGNIKSQIAVLEWLAKKFNVYDNIKNKLAAKKIVYGGNPRKSI